MGTITVSKPTIGACIYYEELGFGRCETFGVFVRLTVIAKPQKRFSEMLIRVDLIPDDGILHKADKFPNAFKWWRNGSSHKDFIRRMLFDDRELSIPHTFFINGSGEEVKLASA